MRDGSKTAHNSRYFLHGTAAVADGVLLLGRQLREGLAEGGLIKIRIVAKAATTARGVNDQTLCLAADDKFPSVGQAQRNGAHELCGTFSGGRCGQVANEQGIIGGIVAVIP